MDKEITNTSLQSETETESSIAKTVLVDEVYTPEQQAADAERYRVAQDTDTVGPINTEKKPEFGLNARLHEIQSEADQIVDETRSEISNVTVEIGLEPDIAETKQSEKGVAAENESRATSAGRLIEYITGVRLNDPNLPERLLSDQQTIRGKYNLPPQEIRFELPGEYEKILHEIARTHKIQIDSKSECGSFFTESPIAGGVFFDQDKKVGVDVDRTNQMSYAKGLGTLEHELIHGLQHEYSPRMPIELMEYEAYIAGAKFDHLQDMDETERIESLEAFIGFTIGASVNHWYSNVSEARGKEERPVWDDPEYFANKK